MKEDGYSELSALLWDLTKALHHKEIQLHHVRDLCDKLPENDRWKMDTNLSMFAESVYAASHSSHFTQMEIFQIMVLLGYGLGTGDITDEMIKALRKKLSTKLH